MKNGVRPTEATIEARKWYDQSRALANQNKRFRLALVESEALIKEQVWQADYYAAKLATYERRILELEKLQEEHKRFMKLCVKKIKELEKK